MALIAIEEHWNLPALTSAVEALPEDRGDASVLFNEIGDNFERLDDIGDARIAAIDAQGVDPQLVLGHWGEMLLFWTDRADGLSRIAGLDREVSDYLRSNIHITSSGMLDPTLLRHALEVTTTDRLLFSTDYPFQRPVKAEIERFLTAFPADDDREKFTADNACSLFGISLPTSRKGQQQ